MALKGKRHAIAETAEFRLNAVAERGYFVMLDTSNEGYVKVVDSTVKSSTPVIGCLLHDVITDESTSRPVNFQKAFEAWVGDKVPVLEAGRILTDAVYDGAVAIAAGAKAYVNESGVLTTASGWSGTNYRQVGVFETARDTDGYSRVRFNCLQN